MLQTSKLAGGGQRAERKSLETGCWWDKGSSHPVTKEAEAFLSGTGELGAERSLSAQQGSLQFPAYLWTPIQTFTSYKGLSFYSAICGFHGSRGSPTWYGESLCVPGRPAEEDGPSCHLILTHSISCLCGDNFFPFQIGPQSHVCLLLLPFLRSCGAGQSMLFPAPGSHSLRAGRTWEMAVGFTLRDALFFSFFSLSGDRRKLAQ